MFLKLLLQKLQIWVLYLEKDTFNQDIGNTSNVTNMNMLFFDQTKIFQNGTFLLGFMFRDSKYF